MDGKPPAVANNGRAAAANKDDDFTGIVERILIRANQRESDGPPLTANDISALSRLCSAQSSNRLQGMSDDLGFADVDPDETGQLVEYLEKHVAVASNIDVIRESYSIIQKIKNKEVSFTIDGVSQSRVVNSFVRHTIWNGQSWNDRSQSCCLANILIVVCFTVARWSWFESS
jgi:hypothetical protein